MARLGASKGGGGEVLQAPSLKKIRESVLFGNKRNLSKGFLKGAICFKIANATKTENNNTVW